MLLICECGGERSLWRWESRDGVVYWAEIVVKMVEKIGNREVN